MRELWIWCPECGQSYWHVWEYEWDTITRCYHCKYAFEFEIPKEENDDQVENIGPSSP